MISKIEIRDQVESFLYKLFQKGSLIKLLSSAKNVMADYAHQCIVTVFHYIPIFK